MKLPDGTIVPSTHKLYRPSELSLDKARFDNFALRVGTVVERYSPSHSQNFNKKKTEYKVICKHAESNGMATSTPYVCTLASPIAGSILDRVNYGLRSGAITYDSSGRPLSKGSVVLVLCPNGHSSQSYIVGGLSHPQGETGYGLDDDRTIFYDFEYNGIAVNIDSDGACSLQQRGPTSTAANGYDVRNIPNPSGIQAFLQINKAGSIQIGTDVQGVTIDRASKLILVESGGFIVNESGEQESWLKSNTYRNAQSFLNSNLQLELSQIAALLTAASTALAAAASVLVTPIIGGMLAAAPVGTAATSLAGIIPVLEAMQEDINSFEQQGDSYLSTLHSFSDAAPNESVPTDTQDDS